MTLAIAGYELLTPEQVDSSGPQAAATVLEWVREYLGTANADPQLGRVYVCPFIPPALGQHTLWLVVAAGVADAHGSKNVASAAPAVFDQLSPTSGHEVRAKTILIVFPDIDAGDAGSAIDDVQAELKTSFVLDHQLMIGEFHEANLTDAVGFEGQGIYPNRSPVPMLAVRPIVAADYPKFLGFKGEDPSREEFLRDLRFHRAYFQAMCRWSHPSALRQHSAEWEIQIAQLGELMEDEEGR